MTATTQRTWNQYTEALDVAAAFPDAIKGKTILVTGVNKLGIGFSTAEALASQSPKLLILAGRNKAKLQECIDALKPKYSEVDFRPLILDLGSQAAVRDAANEFNSWTDVPALHLQINNAGIMDIPERTLTPEGNEVQFATNHLGHFLFTNLISDKLVKAAKSAPKGTVRVINVASRGVVYSPIRFSDLTHTKAADGLPKSELPNYAAIQMLHPTDNAEQTPYIPFAAYGQSKTANVLFSLGLTERLYEKHGILSLAIHPGGIITELGRNRDQEEMQKKFDEFRAKGFHLKTLEQGSSTTLTAALDPKLAVPVKNGGGKGEDHRKLANEFGDSWEGKGAYLSDCQIAGDVPLWVTSWDEAEQLWEVSEKLVGEKFSY